MLHVYEFEVYPGEKYLIAQPYDMDGGTQGIDFKEACEMAADWLQTEMEHRVLHDLPFPDSTFGNEPRNGGQNIIVAVNVEKGAIPRMTATAAAHELGLTSGRISQMVKAGQLETFEFEGRTWITRGSVEARKAEAPKPGRPKKERATA